MSVLVATMLFGRFLGSERSAIMTTGPNLVLCAIALFGWIFFFRLVCSRLNRKNRFLLKLFYISNLLAISFFLYFLRAHFLSYLGLCLSGILSTFFLFYVSGGERIPSNSGSGPSRSTSWTEDSFEIGVLMEPFSETEMEGTSARSSIPRVAGDEAGPSHQGSVVQNASLESSMRNRIVRLEQDNSHYLLDKAKGEYWAHIKEELNHASSQRDYNRVLEFENRDLQIRERKHECLCLFNDVLSHHPTLSDQAPYHPQEAFDDFLDQHRDRLDRLGLQVWERDRLELHFLGKVGQGLKEGGPAYVREIFKNEELTPGAESYQNRINESVANTIKEQLSTQVLNSLFQNNGVVLPRGRTSYDIIDTMVPNDDCELLSVIYNNLTQYGVDSQYYAQALEIVNTLSGGV